MADARDILNKLCFHYSLPGKDPAAELQKFIHDLKKEHTDVLKAKNILDNKYERQGADLQEHREALDTTAKQLADAQIALAKMERYRSRVAELAGEIATRTHSLHDVDDSDLSVEEYVELLRQVLPARPVTAVPVSAKNWK